MAFSWDETFGASLESNYWLTFIFEYKFISWFFLEILNQKNFFSGHPNLREFRQYFLFSLYLVHCHLRSLDWLILRWLMVALLSSPHSWPLIGQILAEAVRRSPHWLPLCPIAVASTRYSQPSHPLADSRAYRPPNFFLKLLLTRTLAGFEFLNNATLIFQKWLVSRHFANIFHYLNFSEEYLWQFS